MIRLLKNKIMVNIVTLFSGAAISQALLFFTMPFITRLFTPEEYGYYALYTSIVIVIMSFSSLKYELAIMLPEEENDANALLMLSVIITVAMAALSVPAVLLLKGVSGKVYAKIDTFMWLIPAGILFAGLYQVLTAYNTRQKYFKNISLSLIGKSGSAILVQLSSVTVFLFTNGLIIGNICGFVAGTLILAVSFLRRRCLGTARVTMAAMLSNAKKYRDFPRYQSVSGLLNALSQNLPSILLAVLYTPEIAGYYALTSRVINLPMNLIGQSVRKVYYQKASRKFSTGESITTLYRRTTLLLAKAAAVPMIAIGIFATVVFTRYFGEKWLTAGVYAQIIIIWKFFQFINAPSVMSIYILGLQKFSLKYEVVLTVLRFLSIYISYMLFENHYVTIISFTITGAVLNIFLIAFVGRKIDLADHAGGRTV